MRSFWMLVAAFLFACMGVLVKLGAGHFTSIELVFYRSLMGVGITYLFIRHHRLTLKTGYWKTHCCRSLAGLGSLLMFFYCVTELPLATAISLNYTWPLFMALFSTLILREQLHWPMVLAVALGFVGVVFLLRPTLNNDHWTAASLGLASGFFAAIAYMNVRQLGNLGESEWRIVFYFTLISTLITGVWLALTTFNPVTQQNMYLLIGIGITATLAQLAMTRAYRTGTTLVVSSLGYSTVLFAGMWGILVWNELLPPIAWLGMVLVIAGGTLSGILGHKIALKTRS
ncbi:Threonine/homoserine efflux transporter RhtA [Nitrosomonas sp. Nm51]|uniref:DMT family transporter n=1 Tax=Nitrosomonas sp. Nm51 TaxID=133720 RepID=UPI0008B0C5F7|nr:DMT family transporter [Nitrosomonas sp. Nm51]SEQ99616.1 Threonine/homoserine efflux transporter RhtA [Nitrosomonas sp. Nm51]